MKRPRRAKRQRKYIPLREKLAAALSMLLPAVVRDDLRARQVPAQTVIAAFTPDHNILHALGGSDRWFNLTLRLRGFELKAKDARDTSIAAKVKRISAEHDDFMRRVLAIRKKRKENRSRFAQGRKLQSRGFQRRAP